MFWLTPLLLLCCTKNLLKTLQLHLRIFGKFFGHRTVHKFSFRIGLPATSVKFCFNVSRPGATWEYSGAVFPRMTACAPPSEGYAPKKLTSSGLLGCKLRPKTPKFARILSRQPKFVEILRRRPFSLTSRAPVPPSNSH